MSVGSFCRRPAFTVEPEERARTAAERMRSERVGALVVVEQDRPVGVVTDRDLALRVVAEARDAASTRVHEVASTPAVTVPEDFPLQQASAEMGARGRRRLPVVDGAGHVVGLLSADDLVRLVADELGALADVATEQVPSGRRPAGRRGAGLRSVAQHAKNVASVGPEATVQEVARRMRADGIGSVVIVNESSSPLGVVTDRDLALRVVARSLPPTETPVSQVMTQAPVCVEASDPVQEVSAAMSRHGVRRILVTREGALVGIATYDDLLVALGRELHELGEAARLARGAEVQ